MKRRKEVRRKKSSGRIAPSDQDEPTTTAEASSHHRRCRHHRQDGDQRSQLCIPAGCTSIKEDFLFLIVCKFRHGGGDGPIHVNCWLKKLARGISSLFAFSLKSFLFSLLKV